MDGLAVTAGMAADIVANDILQFIRPVFTRADVTDLQNT